ncbi:MAG: ribosomal protein S18-alanine N-acetyltransferase [Ruminococcus sp.]|nr:ribosomal protein S18-alanine N-acetyltransferase [Ruminococcus sp.]
MADLIEIGAMSEENYALAAEIEAECFSDNPWTLNQFHEELSLDFSRTFIAYLDGEAAGFVNMWLTPPLAIINNIAVRADRRRLGIGALLMQRAIDECGECSSLSLEVRVSNSAAISFYDGFGFTQVGLRKNFYSNPKEDAYIMTKFKKKDTDKSGDSGADG